MTFQMFFPFGFEEHLFDFFVRWWDIFGCFRKIKHWWSKRSGAFGHLNLHPLHPRQHAGHVLQAGPLKFIILRGIFELLVRWR